jgi:hypothetical protein
MSEAAIETRVSILENQMEDVEDRVDCVEHDQKTGYAALSKQFYDLQIEILKKINGMIWKMALILGGTTVGLAVWIYLTAHKP